MDKEQEFRLGLGCVSLDFAPLKKAELIEGVVYVPSPVRYEGHRRQHAALSGWLVMYSASTPGVEVTDNTTVRLDLDNEPQPDLLLRVVEGGQSRVETDDFVAGGPEFVAEVASSSTAYDLHQKLEVVRRHGVQEYLVWRTQDNALDWFVLRDGRYDCLSANECGLYKSETFLGLWLDVPVMIGRDLTMVLTVLRQGLASGEHREFVTLL